MSFVDITRLERVGGTAAGGYYQIEPRILLAVPHEGYSQNEEDARASLDEAHRIARDHGAPQVTIVLVDRVKAQDRQARRVWANELDPHLSCGLGLVASSPLARAIGSFFIGLARPRIPTQMFNSLDDAVTWARDRLGEPPGE